MVAASVIVTSEVFGFISFGLTIVTWLGVYLRLLTTISSAPTTIPLVLGNLRAEIQAERSLVRRRMKTGDEFNVFPGRQVRPIGKNESYLRLLHEAIRMQWKAYCAIEARFLVRRGGSGDGQEEDAASQASDAQDLGAEKGGVRDRKGMKRRQSFLTSRMGMKEAALSVDRATYYNTDLRHRLMWWWHRDTVNQIELRMQRLQTRRIELDLYECNELVKRGLTVLGEREGVDVYSADNGYWGDHRRRGSRRSSRGTRKGSGAEREVYVKEVRRTRTRSPRKPGNSDRVVANTASRRSTASRNRDRRRSDGGPRPNDVEYEIVRPGRIWVDIDDDGARHRGQKPRQDSRRRSYSRSHSRDSQD